MSLKPKRGTASDCRISVGLIGHHKTKRLIRSVGTDGAWRLVCLFVWVTQNRPDGNLAGLSADDIELAVDWPGDPGRLFAALQSSGFIDGDPPHCAVHDWEEHNPWAATAGKRAEAGRVGAAARWGGKKCDPHGNRMHAAQNRNAPTPTPTPCHQSAVHEDDSPLGNHSEY